MNNELIGEVEQATRQNGNNETGHTKKQHLSQGLQVRTGVLK
jgi:hypothetical protein